MLNLPKSGVENGKPVIYQYTAREISCNLKAFEYAASLGVVDENGFNKIQTTVNKGVEPDIRRGECENGQKILLYNKCKGTAEIDVVKMWLTPGNEEDASMQNGNNGDANIVLKLYQSKNAYVAGQANTGTEIQEYTLKANNFALNDTSKQKVGGYTTAAGKGDAPWTGFVSNLPKFYYNNGGLGEWHYFFAEQQFDNADGNKYAYGKYILKGDTYEIVDDVLTQTFSNQNTESFELPETGGKGTLTHRFRLWFRQWFN